MNDFKNFLKGLVGFAIPFGIGWWSLTWSTHTLIWLTFLTLGGTFLFIVGIAGLINKGISELKSQIIS